MRTILSVIVDILINNQSIPELPEGELIALDNDGEEVPHQFPMETLHKIGRLQTLACKEQERGDMPDSDQAKQAAEMTGANFNTITAQALGVQEDATSNIMMIERLIVLIVRGECPAESERFGVRYFVNSKLKVLRSPVPAMRFLD